MITLVLVIHKCGTPLFQKNMGSQYNEVLLSGFLTALQSFSREVARSCINEISYQNHTFIYSMKDEIFSVLEINTTDQTEKNIYQIIAEKVAREFAAKYHHELSSGALCDQSYFDSFNESFVKIHSEFSQILKTSHSKFVTQYFAEAIKDPNIIGAIVYDLKSEDLIAIDIPVTMKSQNFESLGSMLFKFCDRLARDMKTSAFNELLLRSENHWIGGFRKGELAVFMIFDYNYFGKLLPDFIKQSLEHCTDK